jgi:hypothetical protein
MYGLIVPPGTPPDVAEALEGTHGNPQIDELQSRLSLREYLGSDCTTRDALSVVFLSEKRMRDCYVRGSSKWDAWGQRYGRQ